MKPISRILNTFMCRRNRRAGKAVLHSGPEVLQVEVTTRCPNRCLFCAKRVMSTTGRDAGAFAIELSEKLSAGARMAVLGGWGEPLCGKMLFPLLSAVSNAGTVRIVTSGKGADSSLVRRLCKAGLNEAVISIDHHEDTGMRKLRGYGFSDAVHALGLFASSMRVRIAMTLAACNLDSLPRLVETASVYNASLDVSALKIYDRALADQNIYRYPLRLQNVLAVAAERAVELGVNLTLPPIEGDHGCSQPWETMFIRADGSVHGCCSAIFAGNRWSLRIMNQRQAESCRKMIMKNPARLFDFPAYRMFRLADMGLVDWPVSCADCSFRKAGAVYHERFIGTSGGVD